MNPYEIVGWLLVVILSGVILASLFTLMSVVVVTRHKQKARRNASASIAELNKLTEEIRRNIGA